MFLFINLISASLWGSFLFCMAQRWSQKKWTWWERSTCDHCGQTLSFFQLVPLMSYLLSRGRTACCSNTLSPIYFVSEVFALLILGVLAYKVNVLSVTLPFYFCYIVGIVLLLMSYTDLIDLWVPDLLQLLLALLALHVNYHFQFFPLWLWLLFVVLMIALLFLPQAYIGGADLKFMTTALLFMPIDHYAPFILLASSSALGVTLLLKYGFKHDIERTPFIPFLAFSLVFFI